MTAPRHRLGDRQRDLDLEVVADALEHRRVRHARDHVQVARLRAAKPRLALAGQPDAAAVADAGGDVDAQPADAALGAGAAAGGARILDHGAGAVAVGARLGDREDPLALSLDAAALADRADLGRGAGLGAGAVAGRARLRGRHRQRHLRAVDGLVELSETSVSRSRPRCGGRPLRTSPRPPRPAVPAVPALPNRLESMSPKPPVNWPGSKPPPAGPPPPNPNGLGPVVGLALVGIREHVVGLGDLLEALLGLLVARIAVRVVLARQLAVGLLDLLVGGVLADPEGLVVVGSIGHRGFPFSPPRPRAPA